MFYVPLVISDSFFLFLAVETLTGFCLVASVTLSWGGRQICPPLRFLINKLENCRLKACKCFYFYFYFMQLVKVSAPLTKITETTGVLKITGDDFFFIYVNFLGKLN